MMVRYLSSLFLILVLTGAAVAALPAPGRNKVAYYAFDATPAGQGKLRLTEFTNRANIVVLFEGTLFELCDSVHYGSSSNYIVTINGGPYKYYKQILDDVQTLRKRGVLVLMNLDDTKAWSTAVPFTTYDGRALNAAQYAAFVDSCITAVGLDGISLDIEHGATDNAYYRSVVTELGKIAGPLSVNATSRIYTAAIYRSTYGVPGPTVIGWNKTIAASLNFVMDMGYFQNNTSRFQWWADSIGNGKVMHGFSHDDPNNALAVASAWASWHPNPDKAGVMVFAGNVSKSYTDSIFAALDASLTSVADRTTVIPNAMVLHQNFPNPFNPSTTVQFELPEEGWISLSVYDLLGRNVATMMEGPSTAGRYSVPFHGAHLSSGIYIAQLIHRSVPGTIRTSSITMTLLK